MRARQGRWKWQTPRRGVCFKSIRRQHRVPSQFGSPEAFALEKARVWVH